MVRLLCIFFSHERTEWRLLLFLAGFTLSVPVSKSVAPNVSCVRPIVRVLPYIFDRLQFPTDRNLHSETCAVAVM